MPDALKHYETTRREDVEKTQHAADVSLVWFETPRRFWKLEPMQLAFSLLSRSKQITYENLKRRDSGFRRRGRSLVGRQGQERSRI